MSEMPAYNPSLSGSNIDTDEKLEEASARKEYWKPGLQTVEIKAAKYNGLAKDDDTWFNFELELEGSGGKTMRAWLDAPTQRPEYGDPAKKDMRAFNKVRGFAAALGEDLKISTFKPVLTKLFKKPEKLIGKSFQVELGYSQARAEFVSKDKASGVVTLKLKLKDGSIYQENGADKQWSGEAKVVYAELKDFCKANKIGYDANLRILKYLPAEASQAEDSSAPSWL